MRFELPEGYDTSSYELFQGRPSGFLHDGDRIGLGGRVISVFHTPEHSPGHMCFWEQERGYLFTGDLIYKGTLFAYYPSTDPHIYHETGIALGPEYVGKGYGKQILYTAGEVPGGSGTEPDEDFDFLD